MRSFSCNINALNPIEPTHHKQLTDKLIAAWKEIVESEDGYKFQFTPEIVLSELADWVAAESKCCPFFDFHIDFERGGYVAVFAIAGAEGIKPFIRSEFQVAAK